MSPILFLRKKLILSVFIFSSILTFSAKSDFSIQKIIIDQTPTWEIKEASGKKLSTDEFILLNKALRGADLNSLRLKSERRTLNFENGVTVNLFSAEEMKASGSSIDPGTFPDKIPAGYKEPLYGVSQNGILLQIHEAQINKQ